MHFLLKTLVSALLIAAISELAKRHTWFASILASLPITATLAMVWLYYETGDVQRVARLSYGVFWMVVPSLVFFLLLPFLLKNLPFPAAILTGLAVMVGVYFLYATCLAKWGIRL